MTTNLLRIELWRNRKTWKCCDVLYAEMDAGPNFTFVNARQAVFTDVPRGELRILYQLRPGGPRRELGTYGSLTAVKAGDTITFPAGSIRIRND